MQAISETARPGVELLPELREQDRQFVGVIRKIWTIEPWSVGHPCPRREGKQLHMASGMSSALQASGHGSSPQLKIGP